MTTGITHTTPADGTFSAAGSSAWNDIHVLTEAGGQALTIGAIPNNTFAKRVGTTLVGATPSASSDIVFASALNQDFDITNGGAGGNVNFFSQSIVGVVSGDQLLSEFWYTVTNTSGSGRAWTPTIAYGSFSILTAGTSTFANGTGRSIMCSRLAITVSATNLAFGLFSSQGFVQSNAAATFAVAASAPQGWNSTTNDMTGTNTLSFGFSSVSVTTTQILTLHASTVRKISAT